METTETTLSIADRARKAAAEFEECLYLAGNDKTGEGQSALSELRNAGERALRRDYWQDVADVADDLLDELKDEVFSGDITEAREAEDWLSDRMHEACDGHSRVIYTHEAKLALVYSDNAEAWKVYGEFPMDDGEPNWSAAAYCAFEADVRDNLPDVEDWMSEILEERATALIGHYSRHECLEMLGEDEDARAEDTTGDLRREIVEEIIEFRRPISELEDRRKK